MLSYFFNDPDGEWYSFEWYDNLPKSVTSKEIINRFFPPLFQIETRR